MTFIRISMYVSLFALLVLPFAVRSEERNAPSGTECGPKMGLIATRSRSEHIRPCFEQSIADQSVRSPLCDKHFKGQELPLDFKTPIRFSDLVRHLNEKFKANLVLDNDLSDIEIRASSVSAPWGTYLRVLAKQHNLRLDCVEGTIARISKRTKA